MKYLIVAVIAKIMECQTQSTIYAAEKNMIAYLTVDRGFMNSHFLK